MKKYYFNFLILIFLTLGLSISLQSLLADWTAPVADPPTCASGDPGCDAPLNVSNTAQQKAGTLILNTGGSENGLIVENGKVGVGTTNPDTLLHVKGTGYPALKIESTTTQGGDVWLKSSTGSWEMYLEG
ncbi:MAG: hypothetical protein ABH830_03690, partial [Patescibacteria group bacterium]